MMNDRAINFARERCHLGTQRHPLRMPTAATSVLLFASLGSALRLHPSLTSQQAKCALVSALCSVPLLAPLPSSAVQTLDEAIVEVSEAAYPLISALDAKTFVPFTEKIGSIVLSLPPAKLGSSIEAGIDVFDSVSPERLKAFNGALSDAFGGLKTDSCTLVPLPSKAIAERFQGIAVETVPSEKLKAFASTWGPTIEGLPKTDAAICLPSKDSLNRLSLAQAEVARSFGAAEQSTFAKVAGPALKSKFSLGTLLPLVDDAKKVGAGASPQEKAAFQAAGKKIEAAAKREAAEAKRAQTAANMAAAQASKADPAEAAAAREAAAAEAAAKKRAVVEARMAEKERLKEEEAARIAELKRKAAAIAAAKAGAS